MRTNSLCSIFKSILRFHFVSLYSIGDESNQFSFYNFNTSGTLITYRIHIDKTNCSFAIHEVFKFCEMNSTIRINCKCKQLTLLIAGVGYSIFNLNTRRMWELGKYYICSIFTTICRM